MVIMSNPISIKLSINSIYAHSIVTFKATAQEEFSINFKNGSLLSVTSGKTDAEGNIGSTEDGKKQVIEVELLNLVREKVVDDEKKSGKNCPENRYGMRYYPFVSSFLNGAFEVKDGLVNNILLSLPDEFRVIWYKAELYNPDNAKSSIEHSYAKDISTYIFQWDEPAKKNGLYKIKIPVRIGAASILNLVNFPVFYLLLAFLGVALASLSDKPSYLVAAIAASWVFMLRRWGSSNLPQRNTILTHGYIVSGIALLVWGALLKAFQLKSLVLIIPIIFLYILLQKSIRLYGLEGRLPSYVTKYWSGKIKKADTIQKEVSEAKNDAQQEAPRDN